jgi:hypothetical protein
MQCQSSEVERDGCRRHSGKDARRDTRKRSAHAHAAALAFLSAALLLVGQIEGAVERAIGNENRASASFDQQSNAAFCRLACADEHD